MEWIVALVFVAFITVLVYSGFDAIKKSKS